TNANVICGDTKTLSPFAILQPNSLPPVVTVSGDLAAWATSAAGATVIYTATANDPEDGPLTPICTPTSGATFPLGPTPVSCGVTDSWGVPASASFTVTVRYQAATDGSFFKQPINPDGSSIFKSGSTIPVKFQLTGPSAVISNAVARLYVARVSSGI